MIGGPLLLFVGVGVLFDWWEQTGTGARPWSSPSSSGRRSSASTARSGGSGRTRRSSARTGAAMQPPDAAPNVQLAAAAGPVRRRVRGALCCRLVRERWQHAGLRGNGSGLDELGGRQPVEEPHRWVPDPARRLRVPALRGDDPKRARERRVHGTRLGATRARRVRGCHNRHHGHHHRHRHYRRRDHRGCRRGSGGE